MKVRVGCETGGVPLRPFSFLVFVILFVLCASTSVRAATLLHLQADHIEFYYDRYLVEADGHVSVQTSDGATITGDAFSMDLKLNRFLIAGHVELHSPGGNLAGAAISDFITFKRVYFIPITTEPDRWTFLNGDYTHPVKGRIMPGDTFDFPDLSHSRISLKAQSAVISANSFVRFSNVTTYLAGAPIPLPSYYINFSPNINLVQNSLTGASYDATWNFTGNSNMISALHLRYDPQNKTYASFEQHFSGQHEYAVVSLNPATTPAKFWNLILEHDVGSRLQLRTFSQLYTYQHWLDEPLAATETTYAWATQAFPHSSLQAYGNFTVYNLLPATGQHFIYSGALNHPTQMQFTWTSFNHQVNHLPLYESINYGIGFAHDTVKPLQTYGGYNYTTIWNHTLGFTFYTPSLKVGDRNNPAKAVFVNAIFTKSRQWFSVPHHIDSTSTTLSLSRDFGRSINAYLSYSVANLGDYYISGGYAPYSPPGNPGYSAFRGVATQHTLALGVNYSASPNFNASILLHQHTDFPKAVSGDYSFNLINNLGQATCLGCLGEPPYDVTADVRARVLRHLVVDVSRSYYFNFGNLRWSPQFVVQVTP